MHAHQYQLVFKGPDQPGIVAKISGCIFKHQGLITEAKHHSNTYDHWFFMRQDIQFPDHFDHQSLIKDLSQIVNQLNGSFELHHAQKKKNVVIMVSKHLHCLHELLYRFDCGDMQGQLKAVISNHQDAQSLCDHYQIPFHHIPAASSHDQACFDHVTQTLKSLETETLVLARYMQILPKSLCDSYKNNIINIHHSFLPSFSGGFAYEQAFHHGVKLIGATCHFVTENLDEGPIIDQDVVRISHADRVETLKKLGQQVEKNVLANGLQKFLENRVFIHKNKTIVF